MTVVLTWGRLTLLCRIVCSQLSFSPRGSGNDSWKKLQSRLIRRWGNWRLACVLHVPPTERAREKPWAPTTWSTAPAVGILTFPEHNSDSWWKDRKSYKNEQTELRPAGVDRVFPRVSQASSKGDTQGPGWVLTYELKWLPAGLRQDRQGLLLRDPQELSPPSAPADKRGPLFSGQLGERSPSPWPLPLPSVLSADCQYLLWAF